MQLSYDTDYPIGLEGQLIEDYPHATITGICEAAGMQVGKLAIFDTTSGRADKSVRAVAATGDVTSTNLVAGLVLLDPTFPFQSGFGSPSAASIYPQNRTCPILRRGRILLASETVLSKAFRPFVRFASGSGTVLGSIRNDADTATAVAAPYLEVITPATAAGGLVVVEINLG